MNNESVRGCKSNFIIFADVTSFKMHGMHGLALWPAERKEVAAARDPERPDRDCTTAEAAAEENL
jgi:hypothetical protein